MNWCEHQLSLSRWPRRQFCMQCADRCRRVKVICTTRTGTIASHARLGAALLQNNVVSRCMEGVCHALFALLGHCQPRAYLMSSNIACSEHMMRSACACVSHRCVHVADVHAGALCRAISSVVTLTWYATTGACHHSNGHRATWSPASEPDFPAR